MYRQVSKNRGPVSSTLPKLRAEIGCQLGISLQSRAYDTTRLFNDFPDLQAYGPKTSKAKLGSKHFFPSVSSLPPPFDIKLRYLSQMYLKSFENYIPIIGRIYAYITKNRDQNLTFTDFVGNPTAIATWINYTPNSQTMKILTQRAPSLLSSHPNISNTILNWQYILSSSIPKHLYDEFLYTYANSEYGSSLVLKDLSKTHDSPIYNHLMSTTPKSLNLSHFVNIEPVTNFELNIFRHIIIAGFHRHIPISNIEHLRNPSSGSKARNTTPQYRPSYMFQYFKLKPKDFDQQFPLVQKFIKKTLDLPNLPTIKEISFAVYNFCTFTLPTIPSYLFRPVLTKILENRSQLSQLQHPLDVSLIIKKLYSLLEHVSPASSFGERGYLKSSLGRLNYTGQHVRYSKSKSGKKPPLKPLPGTSLDEIQANLSPPEFIKALRKLTNKTLVSDQDISFIEDFLFYLTDDNPLGDESISKALQSLIDPEPFTDFELLDLFKFIFNIPYTVPLDFYRSIKPWESKEQPQSDLDNKLKQYMANNQTTKKIYNKDWIVQYYTHLYITDPQKFKLLVQSKDQFSSVIPSIVSDPLIFSTALTQAKDSWSLIFERNNPASSGFGTSIPNSFYSTTKLTKVLWYAHFFEQGFLPALGSLYHLPWDVHSGRFFSSIFPMVPISTFKDLNDLTKGNSFIGNVSRVFTNDVVKRIYATLFENQRMILNSTSYSTLPTKNYHIQVVNMLHSYFYSIFVKHPELFQVPFTNFSDPFLDNESGRYAINLPTSYDDDEGNTIGSNTIDELYKEISATIPVLFSTDKSINAINALRSQFETNWVTKGSNDTKKLQFSPQPAWVFFNHSEQINIIRKQFYNHMGILSNIFMKNNLSAAGQNVKTKSLSKPKPDADIQEPRESTKYSQYALLHKLRDEFLSFTLISEPGRYSQGLGAYLFFEKILKARYSNVPKTMSKEFGYSSVPDIFDHQRNSSPPNDDYDDDDYDDDTNLGDNSKLLSVISPDQELYREYFHLVSNITSKDSLAPEWRTLYPLVASIKKTTPQIKGGLTTSEKRDLIEIMDLSATSSDQLSTVQVDKILEYITRLGPGQRKTQMFRHSNESKRKIIFHAGGTNGGKTFYSMLSMVNNLNPHDIHEALKDVTIDSSISNLGLSQVIQSVIESMKAKQDPDDGKPKPPVRGAYVGPLRLLAQESFENIVSQSKNCFLFTGEEVTDSQGAKINKIQVYQELADPNINESFLSTTYSKGISLLSRNQSFTHVVIDEIQFIAHTQQGPTLTNLFFSINCDYLHLTGDPSMIPLIEKMAQITNDELSIIHYDRLSPVLLDAPLLEFDNPLENEKRRDFSRINMVSKHVNSWAPKLCLGDCLIAFSIPHTQKFQNLINENTTFKAGSLFGGLAPSTRQEIAFGFNLCQVLSNYTKGGPDSCLYDLLPPVQQKLVLDFHSVSNNAQDGPVGGKPKKFRNDEDFNDSAKPFNLYRLLLNPETLFTTDIRNQLESVLTIHFYDVLVSTDVIGWGLNFNIRRIVFTDFEKSGGDHWPNWKIDSFSLSKDEMNSKYLTIPTASSEDDSQSSRSTISSNSHNKQLHIAAKSDFSQYYSDIDHSHSETDFGLGIDSEEASDMGFNDNNDDDDDAFQENDGDTIFFDASKYDLTPAECKQIGGRSGRLGSPYASHGLVTCFFPNEMPFLKYCLLRDIPEAEKCFLTPDPSIVSDLFSQKNYLANLKKHRAPYSTTLSSIILTMENLSFVQSSQSLLNTHKIARTIESIPQVHRIIANTYILRSLMRGDVFEPLEIDLFAVLCSNTSGQKVVFNEIQGEEWSLSKLQNYFSLPNFCDWQYYLRGLPPLLYEVLSTLPHKNAYETLTSGKRKGAGNKSFRSRGGGGRVNATFWSSFVDPNFLAQLNFDELSHLIKIKQQLSAAKHTVKSITSIFTLEQQHVVLPIITLKVSQSEAILQYMISSRPLPYSKATQAYIQLLEDLDAMASNFPKSVQTKVDDIILSQVARAASFIGDSKVGGASGSSGSSGEKNFTSGSKNQRQKSQRQNEFQGFDEEEFLNSHLGVVVDTGPKRENFRKSRNFNKSSKQQVRVRNLNKTLNMPNQTSSAGGSYVKNVTVGQNVDLVASIQGDKSTTSAAGYTGSMIDQVPGDVMDHISSSSSSKAVSPKLTRDKAALDRYEASMWLKNIAEERPRKLRPKSFVPKLFPEELGVAQADPTPLHMPNYPTMSPSLEKKVAESSDGLKKKLVPESESLVDQVEE